MFLSKLGKTLSLKNSLDSITSEQPREILSEASLKRSLAIERKRTERTGQALTLLLLETSEVCGAKERIDFERILPAIAREIRDTDLIGWYDDHITPAMIFTDLANIPKNEIQSSILARILTAAGTLLAPEQLDRVRYSFHFFPEDWNRGTPECPSNPTLYCDLLNPSDDLGARLHIKQSIDKAGSALLLFACGPVLLITALAVKLSSRGPVFFRQERVGQYGRTFELLKFRSMYVDSDPGVHKEFITDFITGRTGAGQSHEPEQRIYKMTRDKRVTPVGRFLRRSSLDELPQLINVFRGDMSLVGPRPPIAYEVSAYSPWHRRRFLEAKPGITGLWQVTGRSRVTFDEMVRLDLRYAASRSLWLDFKILMRTLHTVISGAGAH